MAQKPSIPKGTRDFSPAEMMRRTYIFETVKSVFRTYGFAPLETPAMENLSTLLGKYGDEGDKLLFKILNSGDYAAGLADAEVRSASRICEKGLRYDLTFIVIRLDMGIPLHVPYETDKNGYFNVPKYKPGWHLAIGYPF